MLLNFLATLKRPSKGVSWKAWIIAVFVLPAVAAVLGTQISSPAQRAAAARPPTPSVITAKAEQRVVGETVVVNGDVQSAHSAQVVSSTAGDATPIVSDVRSKSGDSVKEGDVLVVISGRPVIALEGPVPAYRDLQPGEIGGDVVQLQKALRRLKYSIGSDAEGTFALGTQAAVQRFYQDRGFSPQMTSPDAREQLNQAKQDVSDAQSQLDRAKQESVSGESSLLSVDQAQATLRSAREKYQSLSETTGVEVLRSEVLFIPSFPASVTQSRAKLGGAAVDAKVDTPLMTISGGEASVVAQIDPDQNALIKAGTSVTIHVTDGTEMSGTVTSVGTQLEQSSDGNSGYPISVSGVSPIPVVFVGQSAQLTINAAATQGAVLAVPSSAVSSASDGTTHVTKVADGKDVDVSIVVGATAGGWVEIRSQVPGVIGPGDDVVVGANAVAARSDSHS
jgi:HlyD family secretion protein